MGLLQGDICEGCGADLRYEYTDSQGTTKTYSRAIGVQYSYDSPEHYDGVSEWRCPDCKLRIGRWSGKRLADGEPELRFGGQP